VSNEKILVVEDETIVAMDIAATLRRLGYTVVAVVASGQAAIDAAMAHHPDLVLMDINLQGPMDGTEAAGIIHDRLGTPIVFLTAHADQNTVERSKGAAPYGYIVKPFDDRLLPRAIELALHRHRDEKAGRAQDQDALWASEERYRLLVDAIEDYAIIILDLAGRVMSWNTGAERMTGYRAEEIIGKPGYSYYPEESRDPHAFLQELALVAEKGNVEVESWRVRKDGSRFLAQTTRSAICDRNGKITGYASIARDVTQRRMIEEQLLQSQKLESLGKLAGGIAHDFNNMLMVISSRAEMLLRLTRGVEPQHRYLEDIKAAAAKSGDLTQQLLAAARRQVLQPQVVDVNSIVHSTTRLLSASIGEDITITTRLQSDLWAVYADPGKLHQVLMNLTFNARDAMPEGGVFTIETRNFRPSRSYLGQHPDLREGDHVVLIVSDTGIGMPPDVQQRIYDPFFTTKSTGTGLGMAVVRGIIEQTGGQIWLYSEIGRGTTFKIFFPRHGESDNNVIDTTDAVNNDATETILLVEDEDLLRTIIQEMLAEHGYQVLSAGSPAEAIQLSRAHIGKIDLLLTDVIMPGMDGRALAERLTAARPNLAVVFMSGYTDNAIVHQGVLDTGVFFIEKPSAPDVLLQLIRTALQAK
jgi:two-component system cell cycle sensor histidine kinase/response regulator CckA